ncbi:NigD-like N-terminal domain-containing protein [uncultured Aquimarina sp.]|uniref:hypothetical protein n=1 Tax=uncultured Aquimarina sp. TaxID=575652 RepID=UPI002601E90E|nr:NigD-like N-terminal domain-containing protein [uncultured Aquimarina sp.]
MKDIKRYIISAVFGLFLIASCTEKQTCSKGVNGTLVNMLGLDGCSWVIQLDTGEKLQPVNLINFEVKKKNEPRISIVYKEVEAMAGICMVGKMVEISCLKVIH